MKCKNCYAWGSKLYSGNTAQCLCLINKKSTVFPSGDMGCRNREENIVNELKTSMSMGRNRSNFILRNVIEEIQRRIIMCDVKGSVSLAEEYGISPEQYGKIVSVVEGNIDFYRRYFKVGK